ncbi:hypothetical protein [Amaricoccus sp.]|uniref:nSTAND1 domain-containing NTPase n=1 Tax=Amaricoccus sp. TaxID=1872485 RepID=UPI001B70F991|nr:hypothetical protein [Amaricoccus sp.]MBP7001738.1 hypothetical protein [Amaricoccus sp.]
MAEFQLKDFAPGDEDRARFRQSPFGSVMGQAAVFVGLLIFIIGGLTLLVTKLAEPLRQLYGSLAASVGPVWSVLLLAAVPATVFGLVFWFSARPALRQARAERRAAALAFEPVPEPPKSAFRLTPYGPGDRDIYNRLDRQEQEVLAWVRDTPGSVLYLSGDSGVGKSSVIAASLVPSLTGAGWAIVQTRAYGDATDRLSQELRARSDLFPRPPDPGVPIRDLLATLGDRRRKAGKGPLLVILDQFEEVLILADPEKADPFLELVEDLARRPLTGVKLLLVYRSDYETEIFKLRLPAPVVGANAFRLGRYNRREAEQFLKSGGRLPAEEAREGMFGGLDRIEGVPGLYRQITLNMVGLFLERMSDRLTRDPDTLIQGYLDSCIREGEPSVAAARRRVLDTLVSDAGTKEPRREREIVELTGLPEYQVQAILYGLAEKGLVRALDGQERTWELAHDFLAALLGRAVARVRPTLWSRIKPAIGPLAVAGWLGIVLLGLPWWQARSIEHARGVIEAAAGSIHRYGNTLEVQFDGDRLLDCSEARPDWDRVFRATAQLPHVEEIQFVGWRRNPCRFPTQEEIWSGVSRLPALRSLNLRNTGITSLADMPTLPALASLNLNGTGITSLADMPALPALASLYLSGTGITSLADMPALPALASLDLSGTGITSLADMPALPALASLDLYGTGITSLADMPTLPALASLNLNGTGITSLADMPALPALASLDLSGTGITSLADMPALPALASLDLSGTGITSLAGMPALPALASLNLNGTGITSLAGMPALPALASLDLSNTGITSLAEMPALPKLARLNLDDMYAWRGSLEGVEALPKLTFISLCRTEVIGLGRLEARDPVPEVYQCR